MPHNNHYSEASANTFVELLGCWRFNDPYGRLADRNPSEYRRLLLKLIEANKTRYDNISKWETNAAIKALKALDK